MRFNTWGLDPNRGVTYEGGRAWILAPELELYKLVMTLMLGEPRFYEGGAEQMERIEKLCAKVSPEYISQLATVSRNEMHLRSAPLFLSLQLIEKVRGTSDASLAEDTIVEVVQRPDQMAELIAMYWREERRPLPAILKRALARCFDKFDEYQFAKWDRSRNVRVRLRDVMFLVHPKPSPGKEELFRKIADDELEPPLTWEVLLSQTKTKEDKRAVWERLLAERRLGEMALVMNLRNMEQAGVPEETIAGAIDSMKFKRLFPYRLYIAAQQVSSPLVKEALERAFMRYASAVRPLAGRTAILVDVSGSMDSRVSRMSTVCLHEAAAALAVIAKASWPDTEIFTFSNELRKISYPEPSFRGIDAIVESQRHLSTYLGRALRQVLSLGPWRRVVVFTDEQAHDAVPVLPKGTRGYVINMAGYRPSIVDYRDRWELLGGFSEAVLRYLVEADSFWQLAEGAGASGK